MVRNIKFKKFMRVIYLDGVFGGVIDTTRYEQLDGAIIIAESYGRPFKGNPDKMAEDVLDHIHCSLSAVIIGGVCGSDERGDLTSLIKFQAVRGL